MKNEIKTTQNGICITLDKIEDKTVLESNSGGGVAVIPNEGRITAPCSGTVVKVSETQNAYNILGDDGVEILVQVGIKTGELCGRGFKSNVHEGDKVKTGDLICDADLHYISDNGYDIVTPILILDMDKIEDIKIHEGEVKSPTSTVIEYKVKE